MQRIIVFTNGARGGVVLRSLGEAGHGVMTVFVPGQGTSHPAVTDAVSELGLDVRAIPNVNDTAFVADLAGARPELLVVAGYPTIFRRPLLDVAARGALNLHGGRLPEYRGGSPLNWQMINGEATAAISVVRMDEGIDTGEVVAEAEIPIGELDTIADLHRRANALWPELLLGAIAKLEKGTLKGRAQDDARACYWHQRAPEDGRIDWANMTARQVHDLVRALSPLYPPAFTFWGDRRVAIAASRVPTDVLRGVPGRVCYARGQGPFVVCRDRAVLLSEHHVEGGGFLSQGARLS